MPMLKRQQFAALKPPADLKLEEEVFYLKLTNEIFRDYDEYFERMILCNSLVWSCSLTGKANLTFQEALDSEKVAKKQLKGFPRELKKALFFLVSMTRRAKVLDVYEDVYAYARERYFKNEVVLGVIGNMWCPSRVTRIIYPTKEEIEVYRQEQIKKGEFEKNDYLKDDSWGPPPDLFRYEVQETDPTLHEVHILEAIDVKREKTIFTRDKCRFLLKLATEYSEDSRYWRIREDVAKAFGIASCRFEDIFIGPSPKFEVTLAPPPKVSLNTSVNKASKQTSPSGGKSANEGEKKKSAEAKGKSKKDATQGDAKKKPRSKSLEPAAAKKSKTGASERKSGPSAVQANTNKERKKPGPKPKKDKIVEPKKVELTPQELKQIELERKAKEREKVRKEKKLIADFKKLWFKPKEDLEVEDLKDLPTPDPVKFKIPNHLFGDFVAVLEFFNCYSNMLKVRDCFSSGLSFDALESALVKSEVAGPLSDILQLLLRAIFRLQEAEHSEISHDQAAAVELDVDEIGGGNGEEAIEQATIAATWSTMYQNTPLHKLTLDHLSLSEVLRLHLLTSGARPSEKDVKFRWQNRGCYEPHDDPGLRLRLEEPQILKTLSNGNVFDLSIAEKLKVMMCLINQVLTFFDVRETMEDSFEQFKQNRLTLRSLQAAEKRKETEDHLWKTRLRADKIVPDPNSLKEKEKDKNKEELPAGEEPEKEKPPTLTKPVLTNEQIEALIEKRDKEISKRKQEIMWKEAELLDAINKYERKLGIHPIGRDRAFRRYWIFNTVAGIFVEHDDPFVGQCLSSPTPYLSDVDLNDFNFVKENFDKIQPTDKEGSDKENSTLASPKKSPKKKQPSSKSRDAPPIPRPEIFGICSGDKMTCTVHGSSEAIPKWSFYWSIEQLDALLNGLTPRGIREKELKQTLADEKEGLANLLKRCPVNKLNLENVYPEYMPSIAERKAQRQGSTKHLHPNLNYPTGTSVEKIMELQLRDLILETEEKIFLGTLGSLKVNERDKWRKAIEDRTYDLQTEDLFWGQTKSLSQKKKKKEPSSGDSDDASSTCGSSTGSEPRQNPENFPANPAVKDLACAVLQLCQSVEPKFFKRPLGIGKDDGKSKKSSGSENSKAAEIMKSNQSLSTIERWESSLMASTSFPQLFMHLFTLDNSIEWSRSVLNARCRICRRKGDSDNMLLCDECNRGHHAYCLKPALQVIPKGDWFCSECRPPEPIPKINRRQKQEPLDDNDINDLLKSDNDDDDFCRDSPRKKQSSPRDFENAEEEAEVCEVCGFGGQVICCDKCPRLYHLMCLDPPKTRVPRGTWYCPICSHSSSDVSSKKKSKRKASKKKSSGSKKRAKRNTSSSSSEEESDAEEEDEEQESQEDSEQEVSPNDEDEDNEMVNGHEEEDDENAEESGSSDSEEKPKMKVKFGAPSSSRSQKNSGYGTRSSGSGPGTSGSSGRNRKYIVYTDEEDSEDEHFGRGRKRKSASQAAVRIAQVAKRLRSDSKENDSSENSNDSTQHQRKRSYDSEGASMATGSDCPKRTRLQRMNTNQCGQNGELDNVILDRLLAEVMKHIDAWPFLKPVSKVEAPDYLQVVTHPMDLGTIKYKLNSMVYTCNEELISDLMLVFSNCMQYNEASHPIYRAGENLKHYCLHRLSKLGIHLSEPSSSSTGN